MELTTAIQSEQHVKKELARRMGELQEAMHDVKEQVRRTQNALNDESNSVCYFFLIFVACHTHTHTLEGVCEYAVVFCVILVLMFLFVPFCPAGAEK